MSTTSLDKPCQYGSDGTVEKTGTDGPTSQPVTDDEDEDDTVRASIVSSPIKFSSNLGDESIASSGTNTVKEETDTGQQTQMVHYRSGSEVVLYCVAMQVIIEARKSGRES
ncbi:hypothetical protein KIN20_020693 [Parelaphostrongylus tenuis]|uniref:Uncharacterized protein n=1 Tax=Parelaphostrongylus tenuis TaxID=148309 RepID=A0AAD5N3G9_PARTN|nr:hypothetical protein KIN20_020693 [Parelaphostrongylus tenuis]